MTVVVEDWPTVEAFEAWWRVNVREMNRMAVDPPPQRRDPETVLNPELHKITDHIDEWKARHRL